MLQDLIGQGRSPNGQTLLYFADRVFTKFGPTRREDVIGAGARLSGDPPKLIAQLMEADRAEKRTAELLSHLALDGATLLTVERVLTAFERDEPLLIEGEPATTKTAGVLLAASLVGLSCRRINCSGMTQADDGTRRRPKTRCLRTPRLPSKHRLR